jgi:hypothetical protein
MPSTIEPETAETLADAQEVIATLVDENHKQAKAREAAEARVAELEAEVAEVKKAAESKPEVFDKVALDNMLRSLQENSYMTPGEEARTKLASHVQAHPEDMINVINRVVCSAASGASLGEPDLSTTKKASNDGSKDPSHFKEDGWDKVLVNGA